LKNFKALTQNQESNGQGGEALRTDVKGEMKKQIKKATRPSKLCKTKPEVAAS
jgi:hypothetical protein